MLKIDELARDICSALGKALERYNEVSGEFEDAMPEHFAVACHEPARKQVLHDDGDQ